MRWAVSGNLDAIQDILALAGYSETEIEEAVYLEKREEHLRKIKA